MEAGIVGLPFVGKTALFSALAHGHIAHSGGGGATETAGGGVKPHVGVVPVPDPRLATINKYVETQRVIPASLQITDLPGLVRGASTGQGLGNKFLSHIRNCDAVVHVVRCFEAPDVPHVEESIDPVRDADTVETELMLSDLEQIEGLMDKARRNAKSGEKEAKVRLEVIEACHKALGEGTAVRALKFDTLDAQKVLRNLALLTSKPVLYVANVDESDPHGHSATAQKLRDRVESQHGTVIPVCAKLEAELVELEGADHDEMLKSMGLDEPALNVVARAAYRLLGMQSFFTCGPKEIRAWTIPIGATAPQAAGAIHSDFERGFIRVEVFRVPDLEQYHTEVAIKQHGKLRVEGKNYVVQEGDVCYFLFNVSGG